MVPTNIFPAAKGRVLKFGNEEVRLIYPGKAHSPDSIVVYFPSKRLLFGGCMVSSTERIGNKSDADLQAWPRSLRVLESLVADHVIPGHGRSYGRENLVKTKRALDALTSVRE